MINIPPKVLIGSTIKPGSAYLFLQTHFSSKDPHFFVVLNKEPLESSSIIVVNATTKIQKRQNYICLNKLPVKTLVIIGKAQCSFLTEMSAFDCNFPGEYTPQSLIERCESGIFKYKGEVSSSLLRQLKDGINASPIVAPRLKLIVNGVK